MTHSTGEAKLDLGASDIKTGLSVSGRDALDALDQLAKRVERLRSVLLEERSRATGLEQRLGEAETRTRAAAESNVKKQLERLRGLEEERRRWNAEREEVLRIIEDLIRKVDSLEGQL
jgi:DNA repair exonuclease SbcCD ATPase subunit